MSITLIGVIDVVGGDWGWGPQSRRWRSFGVGGILLAQLFFFFIGVVEDDNLTVVGWPKDVAVEVTEESFDEFLIPRDIRDETFLIRR
jgi:hypothetical protein